MKACSSLSHVMLAPDDPTIRRGGRTVFRQAPVMHDHALGELQNVGRRLMLIKPLMASDALQECNSDEKRNAPPCSLVSRDGKLLG